MTAPVEVVLVDAKVALPRTLTRVALTLTLLGLLGGLALMLLAPLLTETIDRPRLNPGYWRCVALVVLLRLTVRAVLGDVSVRPTRSVKS